jgi:hypothetical protein
MAFINDYGAPNITARHNSNFLKLTWVAFGLNWVSIFAWGFAAGVSSVYRASRE